MAPLHHPEPPVFRVAAAVKVHITDSTGLDWGLENGRPKWFNTVAEREEAGAGPADKFYQMEDDTWIELNENGPSGKRADDEYTRQGWRRVDETSVPEVFRSNQNLNTTEANNTGYINLYVGATAPQTTGFGPVVGAQIDLEGSVLPQAGIIWSSSPGPVIDVTYRSVYFEDAFLFT